MRTIFVCGVTRCLLALGFFCAFGSPVADAQTTINVPADQPTIQAGIDAAIDGDTVMVAPGTYFENLDFLGKAITVTSSGGPATTIIDGGGTGPAVIFQRNEQTGSVLNGFTLQNGVPLSTGPGNGVVGGGIMIFLASPTITGNVISDNHAMCGIGIEIDSGSPVVRGNTISGNVQAGGGCSGGGGIEVTTNFGPAAPQIIGNTIANNSLPNGHGGGIEVTQSASPLIQDNYISGNSVQFSGGGIALESNGSPVVVQNIIVNNSSGPFGSGAGIYLSSFFSSPTNAVVVNNTIAGNNAWNSSSGIYADLISPVPVINNIVVAASGQDGIVCNPANSVFPTFSHNDVSSPGTGGQAWSTNCANFAQSDGNTSGDPQFVNETGGDYHLNSGSPAIDTGDNTAPNLPQQDYDGNPRVVDANGDCVDTVDPGAYELQSAPQAAFTSGSSISFPDQIVNTTSNPFRFELESGGTACLKVTGISITGDFAQTNNCPAVLRPFDGCVLNVTFTPTSTGTRTGVLTMTGNQVASAEVDFSGNGVDPVASVTPSSLSFDGQLLNTSSAAQIIRLSNTGIGALQISSIDVSGDFSNTNNCPARLNAGASCTIQVIFRPTATGVRTGSLTISSNSIVPVPAISLSGTAVQPAISFSPAAISFGDQILNTSATQDVTVSNPGSATLHVASVSISDSGSAGLSVVSNDCAGSTGVAPGGSCSIQIQFNPVTLGPFFETLGITSDAPSSLTNVPISGTGVAAMASISPDTLSFGDQLLNTTSSAQTVTLSSTGTAPLSISGISGSGDFFQTNNCPASLAVGSSCSISVTFSPTATGNRSGTVRIFNNSVGSPGFTALTGFTAIGVGLDPLSISPASLSFLSQALNTTSAVQNVTVSNISTGPLPISAITISGDFAQTNTCPASLAPGSSCAIQVTFRPTVLGTRSGSLSIASVGLPTSAVPLTGTGADPKINVSPATVAFADQPVNTDAPAQTITVSNPGTTTLHVNSLSLSGDPDFFTLTNNCVGGPGVAPGGTCSIQVEFAPKSTGPASATLSISSDAPTNPTTVALSGNSIDPIGSLSPTGLNFGTQPINTSSAAQTVTLSNTGTDPLTISGVSVGGDFTQSNTCPTTLAVGSSCTIQVTFHPTATGTLSGFLSIASNSTPAVGSDFVTGTGVNPLISASPGSISFGDQAVNTEAPAQTITVSNPGTTTLHVNSLSLSGDPDFFTLTNNCVGGTGVAPGGTCSIQVEFAPKSTGAGSATLSIASDAPTSQTNIALSGNGTGPDYSLSASPASISTRSGHQGQTSIIVSAVGGTLNNSVALSCSNLPTGATCSFSPSSVVPGATSASSRLTINTQQSGGIKTPVGTYSITVLGTSAGVVHSTVITLIITN